MATLHYISDTYTELSKASRHNLTQRRLCRLYIIRICRMESILLGGVWKVVVFNVVDILH